MVSPGDLRCTERENDNGDQFQGSPFSTGDYSVLSLIPTPQLSSRGRRLEAIIINLTMPSESTVNHVVRQRFCQRQQMQWSKRGAHLLLQTRVKTLHRAWDTVCKRWYPDMAV